jgi:twitching motility protein PilT
LPVQYGQKAVMRILDRSAVELSLPKLGLEGANLKLLRQHANRPWGMVLVTGPTGSGKSTTLAAMIDYMNRTRNDHVITIEDPIEYIHDNNKCVINQRELGAHTRSFSSALRSALREDPDIILVGEMRDLETISIAITAAETGHLVLGTLHTVSAAKTVDRIIDVFPGTQQAQVRAMLSESLRGVLSQQLMKRKDTDGRALAMELMICTDAVANLIRKEKIYQIPSILTTHFEQGMRLMDNELMRLVKEGKIYAEDAFVKAQNKKEFEQFLEAEGLSLF